MFKPRLWGYDVIRLNILQFISEKSANSLESYMYKGFKILLVSKPRLSVIKQIQLQYNASKWSKYIKSIQRNDFCSIYKCKEILMVLFRCCHQLVFNFPPTDEDIRRRDLGFKLHLKVWRSPGLNLRTLIYKASSYTTKPRWILCIM